MNYGYLQDKIEAKFDSIKAGSPSKKGFFDWWDGIGDLEVNMNITAAYLSKNNVFIQAAWDFELVEITQEHIDGLSDEDFDAMIEEIIQESM